MKMDRHRIVDPGANPGILKLPENGVAVLDSDHEEMPDVFIARQSLWQSDLWDIAKQRPVALGCDSSRGIPGLETP